MSQNTLAVRMLNIKMTLALLLPRKPSVEENCHMQTGIRSFNTFSFPKRNLDNHKKTLKKNILYFQSSLKTSLIWSTFKLILWASLNISHTAFSHFISNFVFVYLYFIEYKEPKIYPSNRINTIYSYTSPVNFS